MPGALNVSATSPLLSRTLPLCVDGDMRFSAPWEAKAFAIVVELAQTGLLSWAEWVECFSKEVAAATADKSSRANSPTQATRLRSSSRISARVDGSSGGSTFSTNSRPEKRVTNQPRKDHDE